MTLFITTSKRPDAAQVEKTLALAARRGLIYVARERHSVETLCERLDVGAILVQEADRLLCARPGGLKLFWHPNMTGHKLQQVLTGGSLPLLRAAEICPGDRILDGTLGYAGDALLLAHAAGPEGWVVGVEADPVIACLTEEGLAGASRETTVLGEAARRIEVHCGSHETFMARQPDASFDVVFLDPMFEVSGGASAAMRALKPYAVKAPLTAESLREALRICRRRVVVKERWGSGVFEALGICRFIGRQEPGEVVYGVLEKESVVY